MHKQVVPSAWFAEGRLAVTLPGTLVPSNPKFQAFRESPQFRILRTLWGFGPCEANAGQLSGPSPPSSSGQLPPPTRYAMPWRRPDPCSATPRRRGVARSHLVISRPRPRSLRRPTPSLARPGAGTIRGVAGAPRRSTRGSPRSGPDSAGSGALHGYHPTMLGGNRDKDAHVHHNGHSATVCSNGAQWSHNSMGCCCVLTSVPIDRSFFMHIFCY